MIEQLFVSVDDFIEIGRSVDVTATCASHAFTILYRLGDNTRAKRSDFWFFAERLKLKDQTIGISGLEALLISEELEDKLLLQPRVGEQTITAMYRIIPRLRQRAISA